MYEGFGSRNSTTKVDALRVFRSGAGDLGHFETVHFGSQFRGLFVGALGRNDQHGLVAETLPDDVFRQRDVAAVHGVERPK